MSIQAPSAVVLVRPQHFRPNPQTANDNVFQATGATAESSRIAAAAYEEVTRAAAALHAAGIRVRSMRTKSNRLEELFVRLTGNQENVA